MIAKLRAMIHRIFLDFSVFKYQMNVITGTSQIYPVLNGFVSHGEDWAFVFLFENYKIVVNFFLKRFSTEWYYNAE